MKTKEEIIKEALQPIINKALSQQKREIVEEIEKDLDAGMFIKVCSNETTFMEYLKQKLTK